MVMSARTRVFGLLAVMGLTSLGCSSMSTEPDEPPDGSGDLVVFVRSSDGSAISSATVWVQLGIGIGAPFTTLRTDASGHARTSDPRACGVCAERAGFVKRSEELDRGRRNVTLVLIPEARLTGTVVDPDGRPVPRVKLEAVSRVNPTISTTAESDDRGRFSLGGLPPGKCEVRTVVVPAPDLTRMAVTTGIPQDELVVRLGPAGVVQVKVEPGKDLPPNQCTICLDRLEDGEWKHYHDPAESFWAPLERHQYLRGEATFVNLSPGRYRVLARVPEIGGSVSAPFEIRTGQTYAVVLELKRGRTISGRVKQVGRQPSIAYVGFGHDDAVLTDEKGFFRIEHAPSEDFLLMVQNGFVTVPAGESFVDLRDR